MRFFKQLYFTNRFFLILIGMAAAFTISFFISPLFLFVKILFFFFVGMFAWDLVFLFALKSPLKIQRNYPEKLSNGDFNEFKIALKSSYPQRVYVRILEELPAQLQIRDFNHAIHLSSNIEKVIPYQIRPTKRGVYEFGKCRILISYLHLIERRISTSDQIAIPCYPSFIQLKKYMLMATTNRLNELGVKRIRRIGSTLEFESVKEYIRGDEYRFINWKATAKAQKMMVNQYEDEKSQPIYSFIDLGRSMRMPFEELTLLDYAINATLVLSNVSILKQDKAGMLTFSKKIGNHVVADKRNHQMHLIAEALYRVTTQFQESDFGLVYSYAKKHISQRALIFLYTNFETFDALNRQMPYLKLLNKSHIVVAIVFKNTELYHLAQQKANKSIEIYNQIIAEKFIYEKQLIIQELQAQGIQTIFTEPQNLTVNSINKYLEIKARGLL